MNVVIVDVCKRLQRVRGPDPITAEKVYELAMNGNEEFAIILKETGRVLGIG